MTIWQIYNRCCKEQETPFKLLWNTQASVPDFWEEYTNNNTILDRLFAQTYKTMHYFMEDDFTDDDELCEDFMQSVINLIFINSKKYHELWRIQLLEDGKLSLTENYDMTRTSTTNRRDTGATSDGQRTDINTDIIGKQKFKTVNNQGGFNTANENYNSSDITENGSREDVRQFTKGQENITHNNSINESVTSHDVGNLGVQTGADILKSYHDGISKGIFEFYQIVFRDICKELLVWGD